MLDTQSLILVVDRQTLGKNYRLTRMSEDLFVFPSGTVSQELQVLQPEKSMTFTAGEKATLHCTVTSLIPVGPVKWIRKTEESRELIYNFQEGHFPRVTSASDVTRKNNTDFTIHIHDIKLADAGTYFCMKFQNRIPFDMVLKSGPGTLVTVRGE